MTKKVTSSRRPEGSITRVACRRCHAKKIKCTASWGMPCRRCIMTGSHCELIESRRGRYVKHGRAAHRVPAKAHRLSSRNVPRPPTTTEPPAEPLVTPSDEGSVTHAATPASAAASGATTTASSSRPATTERHAADVGSDAGTEDDAIVAEHGQILQSLSQSIERQAPRDANTLSHTNLIDLEDKDQDKD
jgi:hypothetical protein